MPLSYTQLKTGVRIADPLNVLSTQPSVGLPFKSESAAFVNDSPSICPKCKNPMVHATIDSGDVKSGISVSASSEKVYFCHSCRVTHPLKD